MPTVIAARPQHAASWLEIVREVEPLFGPMPDFAGPLERNIARGTAFCVCDVDEIALGGMLCNPTPPAHIGWLAVRSSARQRGIGRALVTAMLALVPHADVYVDTFGDDNVDGHPARRLYESFGFVAGEHLERGPEGGTRQRFWRRNQP